MRLSIITLNLFVYLKHNNLLFNKLSISSGDTDKFLSMMFSIYNFYTVPFCVKAYWHQTDKDFIDIE